MNGLGEVVEVIGTSMDITEQRLAQAKLESAFEANKVTFRQACVT
jgi:hypothetical protein